MLDGWLNVYECLVDCLLDLFVYGECWVCYWLDVVKYVDICGYDKDKLCFNVWFYCDYVVCFFNEDKFYD